MLLHQDIGLATFNGLPTSRAVHALFECCSSVIMAAAIADGRPYPTRTALLRKADSVLAALSEQSVEQIRQAYRVDDGPGAELTSLRTEIAALNRSRLERMLGPDGGYDNWV